MEDIDDVICNICIGRNTLFADLYINSSGEGSIAYLRVNSSYTHHISEFPEVDKFERMKLCFVNKRCEHKMEFDIRH